MNKNKNNLTTVLQLLSIMSKEDRVKVKSYLNSTVKSTDKKVLNYESRMDTYDQLLYAELSRLLMDTLGYELPHFVAFIRSSPQAKKFKELAVWLNTFIEKIIPKEKLDRGARIKIYYMYADMCAKNLSKLNIPISLKTIMQQNVQFPALLENAFPGYIKSGMIYLAFIRKTKDGTVPLSDNSTVSIRGKRRSI